MRTRPIGLVLALLLAACTSGGASQGSDPGGTLTDRDVLILGVGNGSVALDTSIGSLTPNEAGAVATFDGSLLFETVPAAASTTLTMLDPSSGDVLTTRSLPGDLDVRVASLSGESVALMAPLPDGVDAWTPFPRSRTTITVADPSGEHLRTYELDGNYEPEAFSEDDASLFLIQYLPAEAPEVYRVTVLDLESGRVDPVAGRFKTPPERMPGIRLSQVYDPIRAQLYTLYTNQPSSYVGYGDENVMQGRSTTFVHVLSLRDGWAYCAGLPRAMWGGDAQDQAMAVAPDGRALYLVDSAEGIVTSMNTRSLELIRTEDVALGVGDGVRASATIGGDGSVLFVGSSRDGAGIYAIDTRSLAMRDRWEMPAMVGALGASPDGVRLYAVIGEEVTAIDATSGLAYGSLPVGGVDAILNVQSPAPL